MRHALTIMLACVAVATTIAAPPQLVRYQARLTDDAGIPLTGSHGLEFAIFDAPTGGTLLWEEGSVLVEVLDDGAVDLLLGGTTPIDGAAVSNGVAWLEVTVDTRILGPRQRLSSVPYSLTTERLDDFTKTQVLDRANHTGSQPPGTISPQGAGSGLDADTLDGLDSTALVARPVKPMIHNNVHGPTVTCFASATAPAKVLIDGVIYSNTAPATCDLNVSGRGGVTDWQEGVMYLYAIPPSSGTTFDLVMSSVGPTTAGPTGFPNWSYLGSFSATCPADCYITPFRSFAGRYNSYDGLSVNVHTGDTLWTAKSIFGPETMIGVSGHLGVDATVIGQEAKIAGVANYAFSAPVQRGQVVGQTNWLHVDNIPLVAPGTIYLSVSAPAATVSFVQTGWTEPIDLYP